jgi:cation efflux system membrane fusion protein
MKRLPVLSAILACSLAMSLPALAHVGHGDEFQAEGGINRVEVNPQNDPLLGIQTRPIEADAEGRDVVMIPVSALVEDNDKQLVFVRYDSFYEPVPVTIGEMTGEMVEVVEGLSVGEELVTQGSLSLYAESRKTATADEATPAEAAADNAADTPTDTPTDPTAEATADSTTSESPAETPGADAIEPETIEPDAIETADASIEDAPQKSGGANVGLIATIGVGLALAIGAVVAWGRGQNGDA